MSPGQILMSLTSLGCPDPEDADIGTRDEDLRVVEAWPEDLEPVIPGQECRSRIRTHQGHVHRIRTHGPLGDRGTAIVDRKGFQAADSCQHAGPGLLGGDDRQQSGRVRRGAEADDRRATATSPKGGRDDYDRGQSQHDGDSASHSAAPPRPWACPLPGLWLSIARRSCPTERQDRLSP